VPTKTGHPHSTPPHGSKATPVTKLLVFVVENHSMSQMRQSMPRLYTLANQYGYATNYYAITHPSLPNYLVMTSGSLQGVQDDGPPSQHPLPGHSIFSRALASGHTAGAYADSMPSNCYQQDSGSYYVRHNPWTYFSGERQQCQQLDKPIGALASDVRTGNLPNAGFVAPDACHDAHNCPLSTADNWIAGQIHNVMSGPDWAKGRLAIVITADEDDRNSGNNVLTVVLHPSQHHNVVTTRLDHYSLYGLYEDVLGLPHDEDKQSGSMATAFGLPVAG
jgi:acid phosphatase